MYGSDCINRGFNNQCHQHNNNNNYSDQHANHDQHNRRVIVRHKIHVIEDLEVIDESKSSGCCSSDYCGNSSSNHRDSDKACSSKYGNEYGQNGYGPYL